MRVGLLGGTFNPPHLGHLRLAEETAEAHGLRRVIFIPCSIPPHKDRGRILSSHHRLEMTRLACSGNRAFEVSDIEIRLHGPSYTVSTLERFGETSTDEPHFIMGTDSLREVNTWKEFERLFTLAHFIVVRRPGVDFHSAWSAVPQALRDKYTGDGDILTHASGTSVFRSEVRGLSISSTRIRDLVGRGRSVRYLVTESVRDYMAEHNLYSDQVTE